VFLSAPWGVSIRSFLLLLTSLGFCRHNNKYK
jgi:hypothetical protein